MPSEIQSIRQFTRRSRYVGNLVLGIKDLRLGEEHDGCYSGIAIGEAAGGALDGRPVAVSIRKTPTNTRAPKIADFADAASMSYTKAGGMIAFENVREKDGHYTATWANKFANPGEKLRVGLPMLVSPSYGRDGAERRFATGARIYNAHMLHMKDAASVRSLDELRIAIGKGMEERGAVFIASLSSDAKTAEPFERDTVLAWKGWRDGEPRSATEAVEGFFAGESAVNLDRLLQNGGMIDVIPMESVRLGSKTSESIDLGGRQAVSLNSFSTGGLGARVESAIRRADAVKASKIERTFLGACNPEIKAAFSQRGWRGLRNRDIQQFFSRYGAVLPQVPAYGFAVSTVLLREYSSGNEAAPDVFLSKARALSAPLPKAAVPTPSDRDAHARYYADFQAAVEMVADAVPESPTMKWNEESRDLRKAPVIDDSLSDRVGSNRGTPSLHEVPNAISDKDEPGEDGRMDF